jgi:hypothetical protein
MSNNRKSILWVVYDGGNWEITLREFLFGFLIIGIMTTIGYFCSDMIGQSVHNSKLKYKQAIQIDGNPDEFKWALNTDVGNAFVYGKIKTLNPVSHEKLNGSWMRIGIRHQEYRMHTRRVPYTVVVGGKPKTRYRTQIYWSWDTMKRETLQAKSVEFLGVEIPLCKFIFDELPSNTTIVSSGKGKRMVFDHTPVEVRGTTFTTIKDKEISHNSHFWVGKNLKSVYDNLTHSSATTCFWVFWIILTFGVVIVFFVVENSWLED